MIEALSYFVYGFMIGFIAHPVVQIAKKIWREAKLAQHEWKNSSRG